MEQDMLAGKLAEVDAQLAGVHAKLQSAAQMESAELDAAIAQTREEVSSKIIYRNPIALTIYLFNINIFQITALKK